MSGLARIAKLYGAIVINGRLYVWDYARGLAVHESEMTPERQKESERAKWEKCSEA